MEAANINYVSIYLEFHSPTKVHWEPTYESIQDIKDEIKANAAKVNSDLGR